LFVSLSLSLSLHLHSYELDSLADLSSSFLFLVPLCSCASQGGLLAIAILKLEGAHGIEGWRWLFIVEGVATVGCAGIIAFILPNKPSNAIRFSQQQRDYICYTLEREKGQKDDSASMGVGTAFVQAASDPKTWMLLGILFSTYV
jgi:hypothetical protein